jgi:hypothetical protein
MVTTSTWKVQQGQRHLRSEPPYRMRSTFCAAYSAMLLIHVSKAVQAR